MAVIGWAGIGMVCVRIHIPSQKGTDLVDRVLFNLTYFVFFAIGHLPILPICSQMHGCCERSPGAVYHSASGLSRESPVVDWLRQRDCHTFQGDVAAPVLHTRTVVQRGQAERRLDQACRLRLKPAVSYPAVE